MGDEAEIVTIIKYIVDDAKERISRASAGRVDAIARDAYSRLLDLGANEAAEEVKSYYLEKWGLR